MKAGWVSARLGDLIELISGQHIDASDYNTENRGVGYLTGPSDFGPKYATITKWTEKPKRFAEKGDVLLTVKGSGVGKVNCLNVDRAAISRQIMALRAKELDSSFLHLLVSSHSEYFASVASGAAIPGISREHVEDLQVPLPPLEEQHRIVALLDEAFEGLSRARANAEANLAASRQLFEASLVSVFAGLDNPNDLKLLREVSHDFGRGRSRHRPRNDPTLYGGAFPFIQTGDVRGSRHVIEGYTQTYNDAGLAQSKLWPKGTVCITIAANIAETGILGFDACFPDSIIGMVPDEDKADSRYIEYMLQFFQRRIQARGEGSAQANINLATFETERFPFPTIDIQRSAVEKLDDVRIKCESLEDEYKWQLLHLDQLRQSILHRAFAGELS